jgi:hypothetical protein
MATAEAWTTTTMMTQDASRKCSTKMTSGAAGLRRPSYADMARAPVHRKFADAGACKIDAL